eukprot:TRINITY_DN62465_c0_g1_i1.p1 TRINITY_DN62465_c0_g1~~TRINITY_DN62465_c0_g1_i1.p1  ORF type:complete len:301 (+),score=39.19 TRINITY_DN62465_c0_g1_i1:60-962(+)
MSQSPETKMWAWFLRAFLAEIGDKTFLLTCIFSAWCPWMGIRYGPNSAIQRALILCGAVLALGIRTAVLREIRMPPLWHVSFEAALVVVLLPLMRRAYRDFTFSNDQDMKRRDILAASNNSRLQKDGSYGAMGMSSWVTSATTSQDNNSDDMTGRFVPRGYVAPEKATDELVAGCMAFFFTTLIIFCAEAEDKSDIAWHEVAGPKAREDIFGALLGTTCAVMLAVTTGFLMEALVSDHRLNFLIIFAFGSIALCSLSQALLHLGPLAVSQTAGSAEAKAALSSFLELLMKSSGNHSFISG